MEERGHRISGGLLVSLTFFVLSSSLDVYISIYLHLCVWLSLFFLHLGLCPCMCICMCPCVSICVRFFVCFFVLLCFVLIFVLSCLAFVVFRCILEWALSCLFVCSLSLAGSATARTLRLKDGGNIFVCKYGGR